MPDRLKIDVSPEEFQQIESTEAKLNIIYKALIIHQRHCAAICVENEKRFKKLNSRKKVDTGIASSLGLLGGFISQWIKNIVS